METVKKISSVTEKQVEKIFSNAYVMAVTKILLVVYAFKIAPKPPQFLETLLQNTFVKIVALFLLAYISERDFQFAILLSVIFVLGSNVLAGRGLLESFSDISKEYADYVKEYIPYGGLKLLEPKTAVYPGCEKITLDDLQKALSQDKISMQTTVKQVYMELMQKTVAKDTLEYIDKVSKFIGLPYNVELNDTNAPYIATLFMYNGFDLGKECYPPRD